MLGDAWGVTSPERAAGLPCDALLPGAGLVVDRAISVAAPPPVVFRWLCQLRAAPYSYDLLDNLGRRSPQALTPGLGQLEPGQRFMSMFRLDSFAPDDHLTLRARRIAVTYALRGAYPVRLVVRARFAAPLGRLGVLVLGRPLAIGDLVMMRRQLLNLRDLAEASAARASLYNASPSRRGGRVAEGTRLLSE